MAKFSYEVTIPNRGSVIVDSQTELSDVEAYNKAMESPYSAGEVVSGAIRNLPSSLGNVVKGLYEAVTSPIATGKAILDIGAGGLQNILPDKIVDFIGEDKQSREMARKVGQFYSERYGSIEGAKRAFATDPAGVLGDLSTFITGGSLIAPKAASTAMKAAAATIDPLQLTAKGIQAAGGAVSPVLGMTTGVGSEATKQALKAGFEGGTLGKMFIENLRGKVPAQDVLDAAKLNLEEIRRLKNAEYSANMQNIAADKTVLNFSGIDNVLNNAMNIGMYKGQVKNAPAVAALTDIQNQINLWKSLDPAQFHTPEGIDALKQTVGGIIDSIPVEQKTAQLAAGKVYDAIKNEISKQAPEYSKTMKAYSDASDLIREIEKSLSLGKNASVDTAMRKLQSVMRNNVQTNYGQRINLAQQLEAAGGNAMMPALAGQAMSEIVPRGLQRATAVPSLFAAQSSGGIPAALAMGAASSPRLVGEALYGAGRVGRGVSEATSRLPSANYPAMLNLGYQAGNIPGLFSNQIDEEITTLPPTYVYGKRYKR